MKKIIGQGHLKSAVRGSLHLFFNLDQIGGSCIPASFFFKFEPNRLSVDPFIPLYKFVPIRPSVDPCISF